MEKIFKVSLLLTAIDKMSSVISGAVNSSTKSLTRLNKEAGRLANSSFNVGRSAAAFAIGAGAPLVMMAKSAEEAEIANRRLDQVFTSMGEKTGKMAENAKKYANSLMFTIGVDDEKIMEVQAKLATFQNVIKNTAGTSEIFERATAAAFDLQAAGFGEGTQNAVQLGKALQDPIKGMTALARSGVTFTASEKDKIKAMVESGKLFEAQKFLLKAVETQVGGVAKATASDSQKMTIAFGEVKETLGAALLPAMKKVSDWMVNKLIPAVKDLVDKHGPLISKIMITTAALVSIAAAVSVASFIFGGLMKIVQAVTLVTKILTAVVTRDTYVRIWNSKVVQFGIGLLARMRLWLTTVIMEIRTWSLVTRVQTMIQYVSNAAMTVGTYTIKGITFATKLFGQAVQWLGRVMMANPILAILSMIAMAVYAIYENWDSIVQWFRDLWNSVSQIFSAGWARITAAFEKPILALKAGWNKLKGFFSGLFDSIKNMFSGLWDWISGLGDRFAQAGANIVNNIWNGMKNSWNKVVQWFKDGLQGLRDMLPFSPAKRGPLRDIHRLKLVETIASNIKPGPMVKAMKTATSAVRAAVPNGTGLTPSMSGVGGGGITINFQPQVTLGMGANPAMKTDFLSMLRDYQPELLRMVEDAIQRRDRKKF